MEKMPLCTTRTWVWWYSHFVWCKGTAATWVQKTKLLRLVWRNCHCFKET